MGGPLDLQTDAPFGLSWRSHTAFIIATVIIGLFSETFLYGIIIPVLPFILQDRTGIVEPDLQLYSSILLAAFAGSSAMFSPFTGFVADRSVSRKVPFIVGLIMLMAATLLFFVGRAIPVLVISRCMQGASSGLIWTTGFTLCVDTVGSDNMGKTLGIVMGFVNIGALCSPPVGGIVYSQVGVLGVAAVCIGILILDLIMQALLIEKRVAARYNHKSSTSENGSFTNTHDVTNPERQEEPGQTEQSPLLGGMDTSQEYLIEHTENRVLRAAPILLCLRNPSLIVAITICGVQWALIGAFDATIPLEANNLFQFTSLKAGLLFIPMSCGRLVVGPIAGWAVDRYGSKPVAVFGFSSLVPVLLLFRFVKPEPRDTQIALYSMLLALCGIGMAIVDTPSFVEAVSIVEKYHKRNPDLFEGNSGFASLCGITSMAIGLGMTLGPLLAGGLRDTVGYGDMNAVLSGAAAVSAAASFVWLGGKPAMLWKNQSVG